MADDKPGTTPIHFETREERTQHVAELSAKLEAYLKEHPDSELAKAIQAYTEAKRDEIVLLKPYDDQEHRLSDLREKERPPYTQRSPIIVKETMMDLNNKETVVEVRVNGYRPILPPEEQVMKSILDHNRTDWTVIYAELGKWLKAEIKSDDKEQQRETIYRDLVDGRSLISDIMHKIHDRADKQAAVAAEKDAGAIRKSLAARRETIKQWEKLEAEAASRKAEAARAAGAAGPAPEVQPPRKGQSPLDTLPEYVLHALAKVREETDRWQKSDEKLRQQEEAVRERQAAAKRRDEEERKQAEEAKAREQENMDRFFPTNLKDIFAPIAPIIPIVPAAIAPSPPKAGTPEQKAAGGQPPDIIPGKPDLMGLPPEIFNAIFPNEAVPVPNAPAPAKPKAGIKR